MVHPILSMDRSLSLHNIAICQRKVCDQVLGPSVGQFTVWHARWIFRVIFHTSDTHIAAPSTSMQVTQRQGTCSLGAQQCSVPVCRAPICSGRPTSALLISMIPSNAPPSRLSMQSSAPSSALAGRQRAVWAQASQKQVCLPHLHISLCACFAQHACGPVD